jgi:hypothetical protein
MIRRPTLSPDAGPGNGPAPFIHGEGCWHREGSNGSGADSAVRLLPPFRGVPPFRGACSGLGAAAQADHGSRRFA